MTLNRICSNLLAVLGCLLLAACGEDRPGGDPEPGPGPEPPGEVTLETSRKPLIITEQASASVVIVDLPTGKELWRWTATDSPQTAPYAYEFALPCEAKAVNGRNHILLVSSRQRGAAALIRVADKNVLFCAVVRGNPHSAELLPDGNIVVACSDDNKLEVYRPNADGAPFVSAAVSSLPMEFAHNVLWDRKRNCLWSAAGKSPVLYKLAYDTATAKLSEQAAAPLPDGNSDAHDLVPVAFRDALYLTTNEHVYTYDPAGGHFDLATEFSHRQHVKSIAAASGQQTLVTYPEEGCDPSWCTTKVTDMAGGTSYRNSAFRIYKVRWYAADTFSSTPD